MPGEGHTWEEIEGIMREHSEGLQRSYRDTVHQIRQDMEKDGEGQEEQQVVGVRLLGKYQDFDMMFVRI